MMSQAAAPIEPTPCACASTSIRGGWIISKMPKTVTEQDIVEAVRKRFQSAAAAAATASTPSSSHDDDVPFPTVQVDLRRNNVYPLCSFAFVTPTYLKEEPANRPTWVECLEQSLFAEGIDIHGQSCRVKKRRPAKRDRIIQNEEREHKKRQAAERAKAKRPAWDPDHMLPKFTSRGNSLDQHVFVSDLNAEQLNLIKDVYLPFVFPASCRKEVIASFQYVWTHHPKSLRVKEFFETVEAFRLIEQQISQLMALRKKNGDDTIRSLYDLAAGHGLLGVLLAYRFSSAQVFCVDLERRPCFDDYVAAFHKFGQAAKGESAPLSNLHFETKDFNDLADVDGNSFITMIHGCNEATKHAIELAKRHNAGFAAMPCCVRDGLYCVQRVVKANDAMRHNIMVGLLAGTYNAHLISAIPIQITNKNLILFGGYAL